jgi:hypothetical protein
MEGTGTSRVSQNAHPMSKKYLMISALSQGHAQNTLFLKKSAANRKPILREKKHSRTGYSYIFFFFLCGCAGVTSSDIITFFLHTENRGTGATV